MSETPRFIIQAFGMAGWERDNDYDLFEATWGGFEMDTIPNPV